MNVKYTFKNKLSPTNTIEGIIFNEFLTLVVSFFYGIKQKGYLNRKQGTKRKTKLRSVLFPICETSLNGNSVKHTYVRTCVEDSSNLERLSHLGRHGRQEEPAPLP